MHISKIELENIKSHVSSSYEFSRGTTAIRGENGAGKTTIIEAIAWVLFDLLEYKKEDFVRRGAKKGSVTVTMVSGLDEREYVVFRDTGTLYYVTDPRLQTRVAVKKDEVFRFLWLHLGLEPGTDLKSLFRQAIGVPQGTFTAIFLEGATERKVAFDRLLKVEEYRQAAEKLRETVRFVDASIAGVREDIARAEGELSRSEKVEEEYRSQREQTQALLKEIEALEKDLREKTRIVAKLDEAGQIESAIAAVNADQKRLQERLAGAEKAHREIETLRPQITEQEEVERARSELLEKIAGARAVENQIKGLDARIERLRESYRVNSAQLKEAEEKAAGAGDIDTLEKRNAKLIQNIAALKAGLERDEKFQSEIKNGLCPILSQKCLNLKPGQTLEDFVSGQFSELKTEIGLLETERSKTTADLGLSRDAQRIASSLPTFKHRQEELRIEGVRMSEEKLELEKHSAVLSDLDRQLSGVDARLRVLGDPRSRLRYLEGEISFEPELRDNLSTIESNLERLVNDRRIIFEDLDDYLDRTGAEHVYDAARHQTEKTALRAAERRDAEMRATLAALKRREEQLAAELKGFTKTRQSLQKEFREKERLETVAEATSFIRDTLKEAAPRVARNYVYHVSLEAAQMFREIAGNAESTLKWAEDYSIVLEEDGYERPFITLSGGEQMAAALAIRLALLKQLTDIRIAFFDEPTTNMDAERRENLAMQISRITHFDQLFVISHDETFDNFVDNVVSVGD